MKLLLRPILPINNKSKFLYDITGDVLTCTDENGASDTFDFTDFPEGKLDMSSVEDPPITSVFPICPILEVRREEGVLHLELINYLGAAPSKEDMFPDWITEEEYHGRYKSRAYNIER